MASLEQEAKMVKLSKEAQAKKDKDTISAMVKLYYANDGKSE